MKKKIEVIRVEDLSAVAKGVLELEKALQGEHTCNSCKEKEMKNINPYDGKYVTVAKEFTFDSAHNLLAYDGACANLHGHTYKLIVSLKGRVHDGMVCDFKELKRLVKDKVVDVLDHEYLNRVLDFNPTAENIIVWMFNTLGQAVSQLEGDVILNYLRLYETPTSYVEFWGN